MTSIIKTSSNADAIQTLNTTEFLINYEIPQEIILHIFTYLKPLDLTRSCVVNKTWNIIASDVTLWKKFYRSLPLNYRRLKDVDYKEIVIAAHNNGETIWKKIYQSLPSYYKRPEDVDYEKSVLLAYDDMFF